MKFVILSISHWLPGQTAYWLKKNGGYATNLIEAARFEEPVVRSNTKLYDNGIETRAVPLIEAIEASELTIGFSEAMNKWRKR